MRAYCHFACGKVFTITGSGVTRICQHLTRMEKVGEVSFCSAIGPAELAEGISLVCPGAKRALHLQMNWCSRAWGRRGPAERAVSLAAGRTSDSGRTAFEVAKKCKIATGRIFRWQESAVFAWHQSLAILPGLPPCRESPTSPVRLPPRRLSRSATCSSGGA